MRNLDKKCSNCERTYRGEGFKNVCTESCWALYEYRKIHNLPLPRIKNPHEVRALREAGLNRDKYRDVVNEKWIDGIKPDSEKRAKRNRISQEKLDKKTTHKDPAWMKKFQACRG